MRKVEKSLFKFSDVVKITFNKTWSHPALERPRFRIFLPIEYKRGEKNYVQNTKQGIDEYLH